MAFIIWSIVAVVFLIIGIVDWNQKNPVGFYQNTEAPKEADITDVKAYNHAVAKIWFFFAFGMELVGIPLLFCEQNSPLVIIPLLGTVLLVIAILVWYNRVEARFRA